MLYCNGVSNYNNQMNEVLDGLIAAIVKEGVNTDVIKLSDEIVWMKAEDGPKKCLIFLS